MPVVADEDACHDLSEVEFVGEVVKVVAVDTAKSPCTFLGDLSAT